MANKYLDLAGLIHYDEKLKSLIPYPTYIKDLYVGSVNENGSIVSAEDIYKVTNKVYVGNNMNLLTYGSGDFELRQHFYVDGEYNGYSSLQGHGDEIIAVESGVCIFEIISNQDTTINSLQLQHSITLPKNIYNIPFEVQNSGTITQEIYNEILSHNIICFTKGIVKYVGSHYATLGKYIIRGIHPNTNGHCGYFALSIADDLTYTFNLYDPPIYDEIYKLPFTPNATGSITGEQFNKVTAAEIVIVQLSSTMVIPMTWAMRDSVSSPTQHILRGSIVDTGGLIKAYQITLKQSDLSYSFSSKTFDLMDNDRDVPTSFVYDLKQNTNLDTNGKETSQSNSYVSNYFHLSGNDFSVSWDAVSVGEIGLNLKIHSYDYNKNYIGEFVIAGTTSSNTGTTIKMTKNVGEYYYRLSLSNASTVNSLYVNSEEVISNSEINDAWG